MKTRIKELRQENNYTQEILAIKIGANQTTLSRIECGLTVPDADIIIKLSDKAEPLSAGASAAFSGKYDGLLLMHRPL